MNVVPTMQKALWFLIKSPVSNLLPLILEGQQCNEIIQENPIKLAVRYYALLKILTLISCSGLNVRFQKLNSSVRTLKFPISKIK